MKKQKLKNYLKFGILLFGISLTLVNCQKEDIQFNEEKISFLKGLSHRNFSSIKNIPIVNQKTSRFIKSKNKFNRINADSITFTIDTTAVQVIESEAYISYTFKANMFNEVENKLHNYVLTLFNNETINQLLVTYPILEDNNYLIYDFNNATAEAIDGDILLNARGDGCQGLYDVDTWDPNGGTCIDYDCTAGGNHSPRDSCNGDEDEQPYTICTGAWVSHCASGNGNGGNAGTDEDDFQLGGGGSSNTPNDQEEEEPIAIVPYDETFGLRRECRKITNLLDNTENAAFKQKLLDLANPANYATNLDIEFEKYGGIHENETTVQEINGSAGNAEVNLNYIPTYVNKVTSFVHTHPNDTNGTFSVFSFDDLIALAKIIANDKMDTGTFVAFLITKKGDNLTHYALTINNKSKFKDFFNSYLDFDFNTATQEQKDKRRDSFKKANPLRTKYYEHPTSPKISKNNVNKEQMLTEFLNFMEEADMGTTLFETDENFETFTRVKKSILGVKRLPCNN